MLTNHFDVHFLESNSSDDDGKSNSGNNIENISKNKDLPEKSGKKDLRLVRGT